MKLDKAICLLKEIESYQEQAYIVGGYVRDWIRGIPTEDIDICTSMTPVQLKQHFQVKRENYGSSFIQYQGSLFEVTTFRKEQGSNDHRHPLEVSYTDVLRDDLKRRDFRMNTLCMNSNKEVIDLLHGKEDILEKKIVCVGDPHIRLEEDALRILRAIRFATVLDFSIDPKLSKAMVEKRTLLNSISYERKRKELDLIFSTDPEKGRSLLIEHQLLDCLELTKLKEVTLCSEPICIWYQLDVENKYPFTRKEKKIFSVFRKYEGKEIDVDTLYRFDRFTLSCLAELHAIPKDQVFKQKQSLPIQTRKDIQITSQELLQYVPSHMLSRVYEALEHAILERQIKNNHQEIIEWVKKL